MSSQRFPAKMMANLQGRTLLGRVIDRLVQARLVSKLVVATSDHEGDQAIVDFCESEAIPCILGSLDDVFDRFCKVINQECAQAFVRICGDSPLIDPGLVDQAIAYFQQGNLDLVTNTFPRTFPKGQSVEVVLSHTFMNARKGLTASQREHVTKIYYDSPEKYRILNFTSGRNWGDINMSIDTLDDFHKIEALLERSYNKPGNWQELIAVYQSL